MGHTEYDLRSTRKLSRRNGQLVTNFSLIPFVPFLLCLLASSSSSPFLPPPIKTTDQSPARSISRTVPHQHKNTSAAEGKEKSGSASESVGERERGGRTDVDGHGGEDTAATAPERWLLDESGDRGGPGFLHSQVLSINSGLLLLAPAVLDSSDPSLYCCSASSFWMLVPLVVVLLSWLRPLNSSLPRPPPPPPKR